MVVIMNHPEFFKNSETSENDADDFIKQFEKFYKWNNNEIILDLGCGIGNVSKNVILPILPKNFHKLIAIDISSEMLECAVKENSDPKIQYIQLDITSSFLENFENKFDHIFSFYCLHWVENQSAAFSNLYKMLKPGGQMLVTLVTQNSNYVPLDDLYKIEKWRKYMTGYCKSLHPYEFSTNRRDLLNNLLITSGFSIHFFEVYNKKHTYTEDKFEKFILSLNPFLKKIPLSEQDSFIKEYLERVKMQKTIQCFSDDKGNQMVTYNYEAMCAFVSKPKA